MHRLVCKQRESCKCYKRRSPGQHLYCRLIRLCVCSGGTFVWIQTWCILQWGRMVYFIAAYSQEVCFPPKKILLPPYLLTIYSVLKTKNHKKHLWSFDKNLHNRENISFIFFVKKMLLSAEISTWWPTCFQILSVKKKICSVCSRERKTTIVLGENYKWHITRICHIHHVWRCHH